MKKLIPATLSATILVSGLSVGFANTAFAKNDTQVSPITLEQTEKTAYTEDYILKRMENTEGFALVLPYKKGNIEVPEGYISTLVTNPDTGRSFYKIDRAIQTYGVKKTVIVAAFRYGGKALSVVLDVVTDDTAKYVRKNSGKIADAIDDAGEMIHGEILQSLLSAGVPKFYARNIAWAIDAFLL